MSSRVKRWLVGGAIALSAILVLGVVAFSFALRLLKQQIESALGPGSEIGEIRIGLSSAQIERLRIRAPKGWPAEDTLRAERIVIVPDLRGLFSADYRISRITVEKPYVSALRSRDGRLRVVPSLLGQPRPKSAEDAARGSTRVMLGTVELKDGVLEFFDATVRQPPHKLRIEQLQASLKDLSLPDLDTSTRLRLDGVLKGVQHDGTLSISGDTVFATRASHIETRLRGVDLISLQPYLIKASEAGVSRGTLDLNLDATVQGRRLHAPGRLTLSGLQLSSGGGALGTFMGMPRQLVVASLKDGHDRIVIDFELDGNLDDPHFSLNENLAARVAASLAESLGVSIKDMAGGLGSVGQKSIEVLGRMLGGRNQ